MFTVFSSDNGIVMTCGDGSFGCLGHGDWLDTVRPRLIEALLRYRNYNVLVFIVRHILRLSLLSRSKIYSSIIPPLLSGFLKTVRKSATCFVPYFLIQFRQTNSYS